MGINPGGREKAEENGDATMLATTPFHDYLYSTYPRATLSASGMDVGLPEGQMGNSEVGHLNLGAGRIVYQELQRINVSIREGDFFQNKALLDSIAFAKEKNQPLHLIGLVSDGGVHSHIEHLKALVTICNNEAFSGDRVALSRVGEAAEKMARIPPRAKGVAGVTTLKG